MAATVNAVDTANSNIVTGAGSSSVQFTLPSSPQYIVQSVVATVDNTAGGDTTATLTYADTNGEVIAKRPQGDVIPAGDTGTATFALRLTDSGGGIRFNRNNIGGYLLVTAAQSVEFDTLTVSVFATGVGALVDLESDDRLKLVGTGSIEMDSGGAWLVGVNSILEQVTDNVSIIVGAGGWTAQTSGPLTLDTTAGTDSITVRVPNGASLEVQDAANNPIFRVNSDGSLQGKTGKALVFNL